MHILKFTYNSQNYRLDMGTQIIRNVCTGEACKVHQLRDLCLIAKVNQCMSDAQSEKYYEIIVDLMIGNINKEIGKGIFNGFKKR